MARRLKNLMLLVMIMTVVVGCRSMTGQSFGTNVDNKTTTAAVKAKLAAEQLHSLTWVDVDTNNGVVYLSGTAATQAEKETAGRIAARTDGVKKVVNNIQVRTAELGRSPVVSSASGAGSGQAESAAAASPATGAPMGRYTMTGQVEDIDAAKGSITVKNSEREVELPFPSQALQGIRKGDRVSIEVGIRPIR